MTISPLTGREPRIAHSKRPTRRLSLRRLGNMLNFLSPDNVSLDALQQMIYSNNHLVRYKGAKLLAHHNTREARILIEQMLQENQPRVRASITRHLYALSWYVAEPLLKTALQDADARVRESAVYALCGMGTLNAYQCLLSALQYQNEDDAMLAAAVYGLRDTYDSGAVPVLAQVLQATDPDTRIKALDALGICGAPEGIAIVRGALNDPDSDVRYAAVLSLFELMGYAALKEVLALCQGTQGDNLAGILRAFFHATNYLKLDVIHSETADDWLHTLQNALRDDSPAARKAAIYPLAWLRHPQTPELLTHAYETESNSEVKAHIVRVAANLMSDAGEAILSTAIDSDDYIVRDAALFIISERECTGVVASYEDTAYEGKAMDRDMLLGKYQLPD